MKGVDELTKEELEELRDMYYHQHLDDGSLEEVMGFTPDCAEDIPIDVVKVYYEGTYFVEDDFFCNNE